MPKPQDFAHAVASNIHPRNLLARLSAFCARALILPALDHAKDATFTSHAKQTRQPLTQRQEPAPHGDNFPQLSPGPTQPSQHKQAWTKPLKHDWGGGGASRFSSKHAPSSASTSSLQDALAKFREEAAAARAETQAARAEATALREHIAKLEAQISILPQAVLFQLPPTPTTSQPPAHNPPATSSISFIPSHVNVASASDSPNLDLPIFADYSAKPTSRLSPTTFVRLPPRAVTYVSSSSTPPVPDDRMADFFYKYTKGTYGASDTITHLPASTSILVKMLKNDAAGAIGLRYLVAWSFYRQLVRHTEPQSVLDGKSPSSACYGHIRKTMNLAVISPYFMESK
ncbi:hypothetical protein HPB51_028302 [Rhipicephalus microplus]|uniref:Uncharacterized protein n=1 Tax=Rhipicephalus microplus TaxID=6941 RepID=A0A9J6CXQ3_RHIMP|nr:hypothetical protein HPB51_028302 [Rhipicephalus microplus]